MLDELDGFDGFDGLDGFGVAKRNSQARVSLTGPSDWPLIGRRRLPITPCGDFQPAYQVSVMQFGRTHPKVSNRRPWWRSDENELETRLSKR